MKSCNKCNLQKPYSEFHKHKRYKDGHRNHCKSCYNKNHKKWREENKEKYQKEYNEKRKKWREENKEYHKEYSKKWREENKEHLKEYSKKYYQNNKDERNEYTKNYIANRVKTDNLFRLSSNMRSLIYKSFFKKGYSKNTKTAKILGCSFEELKLHLESQFEDWMTWDNHGQYNGELNYGWDVDHIIPVSSAITEEEIIKLNHYTNLQPLCSRVNRDIKRDKI